MSFVALVGGCLFLACVKFKLQGLSFYLQANVLTSAVMIILIVFVVPDLCPC